jgi:DNA modification methylase
MNHLQIQRGDLLEIGPHRLVCGDATDPSDVAMLTRGELADLGANDPPYGMKKEKDGLLNDNMNQDDLLAFNKKWIDHQLGQLKPNGSFYCWGTDQPLLDIYEHIRRAWIRPRKATFRNLITWDKADGPGMSSPDLRMYAPTDEKCLFIVKGNICTSSNQPAALFYEGYEPFRQYYISKTKKAGLSISKVIAITNTVASHYYARSQYHFPTERNHRRIQEYCKAHGIDAFAIPYAEFRQAYEAARNGNARNTPEWQEHRQAFAGHMPYFDNTHDNMCSVWRVGRTLGEERRWTGNHPTPKPLAICRRIIKSSCPPGGLVLDYFLGSGSTMVAAHQTGRRCHGMELSPAHCMTTARRMLHYFPGLRVALNGGPLHHGEAGFSGSSAGQQLGLWS